MNESNTTLHPPWLNLARAAWIVLSVAALVVFAIGTFNQLREPLPSCTTPGAECTVYVVSTEDIQLGQQLGYSPQLLFLLATVFVWLPRAALIAVALLLFWRKSDDWMALLLSLMLMLGIVEGVWEVGALVPIAYAVYTIAIAFFVLLPFIFPNGHFVPRWTRWAALLFVIALPAFVFLLQALSNLLFLPWLILAAYAIIYRYRRVATALERQQIKWVMVGLLGSMIATIPVIFIQLSFPPTQPTPARLAILFLVNLPLYAAAIWFIAICIAIAILRYRLWDIDIIIRKTLTYALVVALLLIVYFGSVILLQRLFIGVIGTETEIITVISTLAIAALFVPLRNRIQNAIDKRFYRKKYDAQEVLQGFAETVRDETDIDKLTAELVNVVQETMQPKSVSVWLKHEQRDKRTS